MYRTILLAALLFPITFVSYSRAGAVILGTVVEVTPDAITVKSDSGTATYVMSNEMLTNTANDFIKRSKISKVKTGCKILLEYETPAGQTVCIGFDLRK
jgi:ribosomal protein S1